MRLLEEVDHDGLWSEKGGVLGETNSMVISLKDSYKTLLTFFNKDIEMF